MYCCLCKKELDGHFNKDAYDLFSFSEESGKRLCENCERAVSELVEELSSILDVYPESIDELIRPLEYIVCLHKKGRKYGKRKREKQRKGRKKE